jgi:hypothetical protein
LLDHLEEDQGGLASLESLESLAQALLRSLEKVLHRLLS